METSRLKRSLDPACNAFSLIKLLLTKFEDVAAAFLVIHADAFIADFRFLLASSVFVTKLQAVRLLQGLLQVRSNFKFMLKYIAREDELRLILQLFNDKAKTARLEAFHVLKIFVLNPRKKPEIISALLTARESVLRGLHNLTGDETLIKEKNMVAACLTQLAVPLSTSVSTVTPTPARTQAPQQRELSCSHTHEREFKADVATLGDGTAVSPVHTQIDNPNPSKSIEVSIANAVCIITPVASIGDTSAI